MFFSEVQVHSKYAVAFCESFGVQLDIAQDARRSSVEWEVVEGQAAFPAQQDLKRSSTERH